MTTVVEPPRAGAARGCCRARTTSRRCTPRACARCTTSRAHGGYRVVGGRRPLLICRTRSSRPQVRDLAHHQRATAAVGALRTTRLDRRRLEYAIGRVRERSALEQRTWRIHPSEPLDAVSAAREREDEEERRGGGAEAEERGSGSAAMRRPAAAVAAGFDDDGDDNSPRPAAAAAAAADDDASSSAELSA